MNHPRNLFFAALLLASAAAQAGNATWKLNPTNGDWNTADNWTPNTVPNGIHNIAAFGVSNVADLTLSMTTTLGGIQFEPGASSYNINLIPLKALSVNDAGITNDSGVTQSVSCSSSLDFYNRSTAGDNVTYTITNTDAGVAAVVIFHNGATAGSATFVNNGLDRLGSNSLIHFEDNSSAGHSSITNNGVPGSFSLAATDFFEDSTAAESTIAYNNQAVGFFESQATAANSTITCSGGSTVYFQDVATAGAATLIADGGTFRFIEKSDGGTARVIFRNAGTVIVDGETGAPAFQVGSLEGDGTAIIDRVLLVGGNNLDATFSGTLASGLAGDWLTKVGAGTLTLAGAGSYAGTTTVTSGALVVTSAFTPTGSGPVNVNAGTLGGSGTIAGSVTIGTGNGAGAFLAPAHGGKKQLTLTIQGGVTFKADATYTYTFKAKGNRSKIDKVVANGVTINSGATINLSGTIQGQLTQGTSLTLIKNTAATLITGTFSNLPDGGIVNVNGNNLQASYSGGDGNDLTLTVVP